MKSDLPLTTSAGTSSTSCRCGEAHTDEPVLDARTLPHAIRHAAIFGALESLKSGAALQLIAPHDPQPLLAQIDKKYPGAYTVEYLDRGEPDWRLRLAHV